MNKIQSRTYIHVHDTIANITSSDFFRPKKKKNRTKNKLKGKYF